MKISEMIYDAAKYPFSGINQLLILGFFILISSLLLGQYSDFYVYLDNIFGDASLFLAIFPFFAMTTIFLILEAGYSFKIIEKSINGAKNPPEFKNFIHMFRHGINELIIVIIYFLAPLIILLSIIDDVFYQINFRIPEISDGIVLLLFIALILLGFILNIIFTIAIPHMAFRGGSIRDAFRFGEIYRKIRKIGLKKLTVAYLIVILGLVVIGGPILEEVVGSANIFGFVIAEEFIAPYIIMFSARFTALIYIE